MSKTVVTKAGLNSDPVTRVALDHLHLDPENPRLPESLKRTEAEIINYIAINTAIEDLVNAIAQNDYFQGEPLVVVEREDKAGHYTVVEGNRRLTALRLLQNPSAMREPSGRLKKIVQEAPHRPDHIPCVICPDRTSVLPYLGFRHITGVKEWEPLAKARYMRQLLNALTRKTEEPSERYSTVARAIGSRRDHIQRNLDALAVYECARDADFFGIENLAEDTLKFGSLYTALGDDRIGAFVGSSKAQKSKKGDDEKPVYEPAHPILKPNVLDSGNVKELLQWMFEENKDGETALGESRNLKKLGAIVTHSESLRAMRAGSKLDYAYRLTSGAAEDFMEALYSAEGHIREAASLVATITFAPHAAPLVEQLSKQLELISFSLQRKRNAS